MEKLGNWPIMPLCYSPALLFSLFGSLVELCAYLAVYCVVKREGEAELRGGEVSIDADMTDTTQFLQLVSELFEIPPLADESEIVVHGRGRVDDVRDINSGARVVITACDIAPTKSLVEGDVFVEVAPPQLVFRTQNPHNSCTVSVPADRVANPSELVQPLLVEAGILPERFKDINIQRIDSGLRFIDDATADRLKQLGTCSITSRDDFQNAYANGQVVLVRPRGSTELFVHGLLRDENGSISRLGHARSIIIPTTNDVQPVLEAITALQLAPHSFKHVHLLSGQDVDELQGAKTTADFESFAMLPSLSSCPPNASHLCALFEVQDKFEPNVERSKALEQTEDDVVSLPTDEHVQQSMATMAQPQLQQTPPHPQHRGGDSRFPEHSPAPSPAPPALADPALQNQPPVELVRLMREKPQLEATIQSLIDLELHTTYSTQQLQDALLRSSTVAGVMDFLLADATVVSTPERFFECALCMAGDLPIEHMYTLDCEHSHRFCFECLFRVISRALAATDGEDPRIPACPLSNVKGPAGNSPCHHLISVDEAKQILRNYRQEQQSVSEDHGTLVEQCEQLQEVLSKLWLVKGYVDCGGIRCPKCEGGHLDGVWLIPAQRYPGTKIECPRCKTKFCSECSRTPYHYNTACHNVVPIAYAWLRWLRQGRLEYIEAIARQNAEYQQLLYECQTKAPQHEEETRQFAERYQELQLTTSQDENLAELHRLCPRCKRPTMKLDGANDMVCWTIADSSPGCGFTFDWSTAPRYLERYTVVFDPALSAAVAQVRHTTSAGDPLPCSLCHSAIIGPLLRCINCPAFEICVQCHLKNGHQHAPGHVFQIVIEAAGEQKSRTR